MSTPAFAQTAVTQFRVRVTRHPEWSILIFALFAWVLLLAVHYPVLGHPPATSLKAHSEHLPTGASGDDAGPFAWLAVQASWLLMIAAMMIPSTLPMARYVGLNSLWRRRQRSIAVFMAAYLVVWASFGALGGLFFDLVSHLVATHLLISILLVVAAIWELTRWKQRSMRACLKTAPLAPAGFKADVSAARFGVRNGVACVTGCWALMATMLVSASLSLLSMAGMTIVVGLEKMTGKTIGLRRATAGVLLVAAVSPAMG